MTIGFNKASDIKILAALAFVGGLIFTYAIKGFTNGFSPTETLFMLSFPSYFIGGSIILDIISALIEKYDKPTPKINYDDITSNQYDQTNNENNVVTIYEDNS